MEKLPGRVYLYRLSPLKDERGMVKNVVLFMDDVTEKKRQQRRFQGRKWIDLSEGPALQGPGSRLRERLAEGIEPAGRL